MAVDERLPFFGGFGKHAQFLVVLRDRIRVVSGDPFRGYAGYKGDNISGKDKSPIFRMDIGNNLPRSVPIIQA